jgi:hypothetical protein
MGHKMNILQTIVHHCSTWRRLDKNVQIKGLGDLECEKKEEKSFSSGRKKMMDECLWKMGERKR